MNIGNGQTIIILTVKIYFCALHWVAKNEYAVFGGGVGWNSTVSVDRRDMKTKQTLFLTQVMLVLLLMLSGSSLLFGSPNSPILNVEPGIRGDVVTRLSVRDVYMEFCVKV